MAQHGQRIGRGARLEDGVLDLQLFLLLLQIFDLLLQDLNFLAHSEHQMALDKILKNKEEIVVMIQ